MRASPAKAINSISMPFFWKNPFFMPTSSGTNENASGTALPTRRVSAEEAGESARVPAASAAATDKSTRRARVDGMRDPSRFIVAAGTLR